MNLAFVVFIAGVSLPVAFTYILCALKEKKRRSDDLARFDAAVQSLMMALKENGPADLSGANLSGADLSGANLRGADLRLDR